jgi:hypothetical protein
MPRRYSRPGRRCCLGGSGLEGLRRTARFMTASLDRTDIKPDQATRAGGKRKRLRELTLTICASNSLVKCSRNPYIEIS